MRFLSEIKDGNALARLRGPCLLCEPLLPRDSGGHVYEENHCSHEIAVAMFVYRENLCSRKIVIAMSLLQTSALARLWQPWLSRDPLLMRF